MARKRLGGPLPDYLDGSGTGLFPSAAPEAGAATPVAAMPIAQVAGETAAMAALAAVSEELASARAGGRMVLALPLDAVVADFLIRDRIAIDPAEMAALKQSLMARGQQMPVEVAEIGPDRSGAMRYGLISGARRLEALRDLALETGEARFATVLALLRRPEGGAAPYVAMVEENEIRVGLSFYERARIVMRAVEAGVYPSQKAALQGLFATASLPRRSKVKSFIPVVAALDGALRFPVRIPERLGLRLSRALAEEPEFAARAAAALQASAPATAEAEARLLQAILRGPGPEEAPPADRGAAGAEPELRISARAGRIVIEGPGADAALARELRSWIAGRETAS
jgi:ParB family chromosome partitioning protein